MFKLLIAILPVILIGMFIYFKDKEKESKKIIFKLFMGGVFSCFPAAIIGLIFEGFFPELQDMNIIHLVIYVFILVAFVEEICKFIILKKISYNNHEFDTLYDMILYSSFVALGFACFENVLYVMDSGISVGLLRAITAVPGHVCDGVLMGFYLALAKYNDVIGNKKTSNKYMLISIIVPVITHGIYDFCLFFGHIIFVIIFVIFVIILYIICIKKINHVSKNDIKFIFNNKYCGGCGSLVSTNYCGKCGRKNN